MAKEEKKEEVVKETKVAKSDRELRWEAFVESFKKSNPAKYEIKVKSGELSKIPENF